MAFPFSGHLCDDLSAAGNGLETDELEMTAQTTSHRHRRRKPHAIEAVVDSHAYIADFERGPHHDGQQTEGQMTMGHCGAEGPGSSAFRIDMYPLVIAGDGRKLIDARLIDGEPITGSENRPNECLQFR